MNWLDRLFGRDAERVPVLSFNDLFFSYQPTTAGLVRLSPVLAATGYKSSGPYSAMEFRPNYGPEPGEPSLEWYCESTFLEGLVEDVAVEHMPHYGRHLLVRDATNKVVMGWDYTSSKVAFHATTEALDHLDRIDPIQGAIWRDRVSDPYPGDLSALLKEDQ